jgi:hypothetical protein
VDNRSIMVISVYIYYYAHKDVHGHKTVGFQ